MEGDDAHRVAAQPEEHGVAEADHGAVADHQVQADRRQSPSSSSRREQAARLGDQHDRHQHIDTGRRQAGRQRVGRGGREHRGQHLRQEGSPQAVHHADQQGASQGATHRTDPADHDDHEGGDQDAFAHADFNGQQRRGHHAGQPAQQGAQAEHQRVELADVDAQRVHHFAVVSARTDQHTDARAVDEPPQTPRHQRADRDERQADHRILESRRQRHRAFQERRDAHQRRAPPEDQADRFVRKQQQAERGQHLVQVIALVQLADHQHLDRHAVQAGTQQGRQHAGQERPRGADRVGGAIRAHHVEGPVRQVHHAHDPEDQQLGVGVLIVGHPLAAQVRRQRAVAVFADAHQVKVLDGMLVGIHAERAAQRREFRLAQRRAEFRRLGQVAARGLQARADQIGGVVSLHRVIRRHAAVGFFKGLHECLGLRIVEVLRPDAGGVGPDRRVARCLNHARIHRKAGHQHRDGLVQARRRILLDEIDAGAARMELSDWSSLV
ncbi:hypothetical protein G6F65_014419 [Rhizopus arrhizus]|nr:hypothetical protein G6F65_014419 [Rhizopus arrhizus]